jgi:quercetin dioxygenase-like cupin family protein
MSHSDGFFAIQRDGEYDMEYGVTHREDVPLTDMNEMLDGMLDVHVQSITSQLEMDEMVANLWHFEPDDEMPHHVHSEQEELFYITEGKFVLKLGEPGNIESVEVGPGAFYAAGPGVGHGHRYVGDDEGVILAIGAPAVTDVNPETWTPTDMV